MAVLGFSGSVEGIDSRSQRVLAEIRPVPETPWFLVAEINRDEIYAPLYRLAWLALAIMIILTGASGLVAGLVWKARESGYAQRELAVERQRLALAERVNHLMKSARDAIILTDEKERILEVNDRMLELYGYSRDELRDLKVPQLRAPETRAEFPQQMKWLASQGHAEYETLARRKDGSPFPVDISASALEINGERVRLSIIRDITQRKAHEREIERWTGLYATLSQIIQCIVRVQSRKELFQKVCRIASEHSGFKVVWIGWLDRETHAVVPVGQAGDSAGYVDGIEVYADERPEGRGAIGTCIREDRTCIFNDILNKRLELPWHDVAAAHGLRSAAAMPIHFNGEVCGAFTVYAGEPNVFQDKEVALLEKAAVDISFALSNLDREEKRRRAEEALQVSEQRFRDVSDASGEFIWEIDRHGRFTYVSERVEALLGYRPDEILGRRSFEFSDKEDRRRQTAFLPDITQDRARFRDFEHCILSKSGRPIWLSATGIPIVAPAGELLGFRGASQDITERKQMEAEREITVRLLRLLNTPNTLQELMPEVTLLLQEWSGCEAVGIRLHDDDDFPYTETRGFPPKFVRMENQLCLLDMSGRLVRDDCGNTVLECMCGNVLCGRFDPSKPFFTARGSFWSNCTTDLLASTTDADRQARTRNRCNGEGYESVALIALRTGTAVHGLLQFNDHRKSRFTPERIAILERLADNLAHAVAHRQGQENLWEIEEQHRIALEAADLGTWKHNFTGGTVHFDARGRAHLGFEHDEVPFEQVMARVHPDDAGQLESVLAAAHAPATSTGRYSTEIRIVHPDDAIRWLAMQAHVHFEGEGAARVPILEVGTTQDVTESKAAEQALKASEERYRQAQKMEAIGQLSGGVAHDFNNILTVIEGNAKILASPDTVAKEIQESAAEISDAAKRAGNLTRQLLMFSRRQTMQLRDLDLNELVAHTAKMLQRILGEDIRIQLRFAPRPLLLHADAGMMDQILLNLAVNSRDAMPKGGQLLFETAEVDIDEEAAAHESGQAMPGAYACLTVSDSGSGIPPEFLPRIFEPFFTTKEVGKGTGLGLATVFGIVQQHHGWIGVTSEVGLGTIFRIHLPRLAATTKPKFESSALSSMRGNNETILVVEDELPLRVLVRRILSRFGYRILEAGSGPDALQQWELHRDEIQLLFTDVVIPDGLTGIELAERFLKDRPDLKVIYTSGYSADLAGKEMPDGRGFTFLAKPYEPDRLAEEIRACLNPDYALHRRN